LLSLTAQPLLAAQDSAATLTFPSPIVLTPDSSAADVLRQSENFDGEELTVGDDIYVFDENDHLRIKPKIGFWCWLLRSCTKGDESAVVVDQEEAKTIVQNIVIPDIQLEMQRETGRVLPLLGFSWPKLLGAGTVVERMFSQNAPVNVSEDSWFFFLDLDPHAGWGHRAEYVLVDAATGDVFRKRVFSPPVLDGETWYVSVEERFDSPDRFFPTSIDDLPAAGDWPLVPESESAADDPEPELLSGTENMHTYPSIASLLLRGIDEASAAGTQPCAEPRKKVAIVINGEHPDHAKPGGYQDGKSFQAAAGAAMGMFRRLGVQSGDMHYMNPQTHPTLAEVKSEVDRIIATIDPCDKLFFYVGGHGTITDEDDDDKPDSLSSSITYNGSTKGYMNKGRGGDLSIAETLEQVKAKDVNIILDSCFSGSFQELAEQQAVSPQDGSTWHVFTSADKDHPSYGDDDPYRAGPYMETLWYCVALKMREIQNPTIEQIEAAMRECQKEMADNPEPGNLAPEQPSSVISTVITLETGSRSVQEGDEDSTTSFNITLKRSNTLRSFENIPYYIYVPSEPAANQATAGRDHENIRENRAMTASLTGDSLSTTISIGVYGDNEVEGDEVFYIWFPTLHQMVLVTIVDDDKPEEQASVPPQTSIPQETAVVTLPPIVMDGSTAVGLDYVIEWTEEELNEAPQAGGDGTITIDMNDLKVGAGETVTVDVMVEGGEGAKPAPITVKLCDPCENERLAVENKAKECEQLSAQATAAETAIGAAQGEVATAQADLAAAEAALDTFNNPRSSASSDGRTTDSTDLRIMEAYNRSLWSQYANGELTAQELEAKWEQGLSDEERQRLREEEQQRLEDEVAKAIDRLDAAETALAQRRAAKEAADAAAAACKAELEALRKAYEDCVKEHCTLAPEDMKFSVTMDVRIIDKYDWNIPDYSLEFEEADPVVEEETDDTESFWCEWFGLFCDEEEEMDFDDSEKPKDGDEDPEDDLDDSEQPEDGDENTEEDSDDPYEGNEEGAQNEECTVGADADACGFACEVDCVIEYTRPNGKGCYTCPNLKDVFVPCDGPTQDQSTCDRGCPRICELTYTRADGRGCYTCPTKSEECEAPTLPMEDCRKTCSGTCENSYTLSSGTECVTCKENLVAPRYECDGSTTTFDECLFSCRENDSESCEKVYMRPDGVDCYECKKQPTTTVPAQCPNGTSELAACEDFCTEDGGECKKASTRSDGVSCYRCEDKPVTTPPPSCPANSASLHDCQEMCPEDGSCTPISGECYRCDVLTCPNGTTKNECPSSCPNGCDVAAQQGDTTCYKCKQSCEDVCAGQGYAQVGIDWSNYIQSYISEYTCVSGASIGIQQATIGSCVCSNQPSITMNTTVPICKGTPCGDVTCGSSTSCPVEGGTVTVNCNWSGWQKVDVNQFKPVIGQ
jgi:hypothetical protein